jgi:hypothetical protein
MIMIIITTIIIIIILNPPGAGNSADPEGEIPVAATSL